MTRTLPLLRRLRVRMRPTERPPVAVEIAPGGVLAAAKASASEIKYAFRELPDGAMVASACQPNLRSTETIVTALRSALEEVTGLMRSVTVLLPDPASRVFSLEFDSLPDNPADVMAVLRLRLKRVVPFDVDVAKISYQALHYEGNGCKVLVVVVPRNVLNEYEAAVRSAGYEPGAVLPSALSALAALDSDEPALSAYLSEVSLTTSISMRNNILLYRTHELPEDSLERTADIQRDIAVALAYFEDELKTIPTCVHYAGNVPVEEFTRSMLNRQIPVKDYLAGSQSRDMALPESSNATGLVGALAGARFA